MIRFHHLRAEFPPLVRLAVPLILGELGWTAMSLVDTVMVGRMDHAALAMAQVALAGVLFNTLCFGMAGVLLGLDALMSQAFGARDIAGANRWLVHGLVSSFALSAALLAIFAATPHVLAMFPVDHAILAGAIPALRGLTWGVLPLLLYFTLRRYLQAAHKTRAIAWALVSANLINALFDWLLIYGHAWRGVTIPAFGVVGSSWSTSLARLYLMLFLAVALWRANREHSFGIRETPRNIELARLRELFLRGGPIGAQILVEIAVFALVTSLIATFGPVPLAGHEIALQCASSSFMVPLAISSAASVRVGHALGRRSIGEGSLEQVAAAGWSGILAGASCMLVSAAIFISIPRTIAHLFTPDPAVIGYAASLLTIAACFQFFDGVQVTASGAMRGAGETTTPLITHTIVFWLIGLPLAWWLGFRMHFGPRGLWMGLALALALAAVLLVGAWTRVLRRMATG